MNYNKKRKYIVIAVLIAVVLIIVGIFTLPSQLNLISFKNDLKNNLKKYDVTDIKLSISKDYDNPSGFGYNVIIKGKSKKISEKDIFSYIDYIESLDYLDSKDNYLYAKNIVVYINDTKYDKSICGYDCLTVNDEYLLNVENGDKEEIKNSNNNHGSNGIKINASDTDLWICAMDIVENNLKAPSSAKFGSMADATIKHLGDNKYVIRGTVEAQNSYGAMLNNYFEVTFVFTGKGYKEATCDFY